MTTPTDQPADRPPTDGAALLDGLRAALTRYVILPGPQAADAVTLWIAATHAQPAWPNAPARWGWPTCTRISAPIRPMSPVTPRGWRA